MWIGEREFRVGRDDDGTAGDEIVLGIADRRPRPPRSRDQDLLAGEAMRRRRRARLYAHAPSGSLASPAARCGETGERDAGQVENDGILGGDAGHDSFLSALPGGRVSDEAI